MSKPLGRSGGTGQMLYPHLKPGEHASVLNTSHPHNGHVDATLYQKATNGQIYPVDKVHLTPGSFKITK